MKPVDVKLKMKTNTGVYIGSQLLILQKPTMTKHIRGFQPVTLGVDVVLPSNRMRCVLARQLSI